MSPDSRNIPGNLLQADIKALELVMIQGGYCSDGDALYSQHPASCYEVRTVGRCLVRTEDIKILVDGTLHGEVADTVPDPTDGGIDSVVLQLSGSVIVSVNHITVYYRLFVVLWQVKPLPSALPSGLDPRWQKSQDYLLKVGNGGKGNQCIMLFSILSTSDCLHTLRPPAL